MHYDSSSWEQSFSKIGILSLWSMAVIIVSGIIYWTSKRNDTDEEKRLDASAEGLKRRTAMRANAEAEALLRRERAIIEVNELKAASERMLKAETAKNEAECTVRRAEAKNKARLIKAEGIQKMLSVLSGQSKSCTEYLAHRKYAKTLKKVVSVPSNSNTILPFASLGQYGDGFHNCNNNCKHANKHDLAPSPSSDRGDSPAPGFRRPPGFAEKPSGRDLQ